MDTQKRWQSFQEKALNVHYLDTNTKVAEAAKWVRELDPQIVALDFETTFKKPGFSNSMGGALRLIQIGIDEPERGITPQQLIIDCHTAYPKPFYPLLKSKLIEKQIHNLNFEMEWCLFHLGFELGNIYDTLAAFRVVQRELKKRDPRIANSLLPGWESHQNTLGHLVERYLGMKMPKEHGGSWWGSRKLSAGQMAYAASDVAVMPPLVAVVKPLIERIGVAHEVDESIARQKERVHASLQRARARRKDDTERVRRAMKRARNKRELRDVLLASRQMAVCAKKRVELDCYYSERRQALPR